MIVVGTDIQVTALAQAASRRKMHFVNLLAGQLKLAPEPGTLLNTCRKLPSQLIPSQRR
jgi:hypothetical protein